MPEALLAIPFIAEAAGAVSSAAAGIGLTISAASVVTAVVDAALSVGLSYAASLFTSKPSLPSQASQITINESTVSRTRVYGRCLLGGARIFWENVPGARLTAIAHCQGPIDGVEAYWLDDELATFSVSLPNFGIIGNVATPNNGHTWVQTFSGAGVQPASSLALAADTLLTAADMARGLCYTVASFGSVAIQDFVSTYKSGEPVLRIVARGAQIYDPRGVLQNPVELWDAPVTWAWSDNPALCILDYMRHPDGRNIPLTRFDLGTFSNFANLCDQLVLLKHGGSEKRYRLDGTYQLNDEPTAVMQRMLATCDGEIYRTAAGLIGIRGGGWIDPTVIFQGDAILGLSLTQGVGKMAAFTRTTITYTSPDQDYQSVECDPWIDAAAESLIGSLPTALALDMVPSNGQARRLAKINAAKGNPDWKGTISLDITGLNALNERVVRVILPADDLGLDETFLVTKALVASDLSRVDLTVVSLSISAYQWQAAIEEGEAPPIIPTLTGNGIIPVPTGLAAVVHTGSYGGAVVSSITISVTPPTDTSLLLLVEYAIAGSGDWMQGTALVGIYKWNTGALPDGVSYDVQAKFVATTSQQSDWTATTTVTISASGTAPASPAALTSAGAGSTVTLGATAPNSSSVDRIVLWRSGGVLFASATRLPNVYCSPNQTISASDSPGAGTWHYWATAEAAGGQSSAPIGYSTVTI